MVSGVISVLVILRSTRKKAEQAIGNKSVSSTIPQCLHQLSPPGACPVLVLVLISFSNKQHYGSVSQTSPFLPNMLWSWCFFTSTESLRH